MAENDNEPIGQSDDNGRALAIPREVKSVAPRPFRKANETIGMRPRKGRLTLLSWKIYHALIHHSQVIHQQRLRTRSKDGAGESEKTFTMRLSNLLADAHYDSNSVRLVKEHIREMQTTLIEWNSDTESDRHWQSAQLLGTVTIHERRAPHPTMVTWSFPEGVHDRVLVPTQYTKMMLDIGANMRTLASAVLLETALRYLTSPSRLTSREDVHWWASVLTGRSDIETVDYRYFKRDVLRPALAEVESLQDEFTLELIEHRAGRRVEELQFQIHRKVQGNLGVTESRNVFDLELLERIRRLGLKEADADAIYAQNDEALLRMTVDAVETRMRNLTLKPVESPAAFFRDALKKGYAASMKARVATELNAPPPTRGQTEGVPAIVAPERKSPEVRRSLQTVREDWIRALAKRAESAFGELDVAEQLSFQQQFEAECLPGMLEPIARAWKEEGVHSKSAKHTFFKWMATLPPYEEPTADQLLEFTLAGNQLPPP